MTTIEINAYIQEYVDLMTVRAKDYEERLRNKVQAMKSLPEFENALWRHGSAQPLWESRTEAQYIEDDAKDLHLCRSRLYQAVWLMERGDREFCLCHAECDRYEYELLLEPYGPYYDHWRVALVGGSLGNEEVSFSNYGDAQIWFLNKLSQLPQSH